MMDRQKQISRVPVESPTGDRLYIPEPRPGAEQPVVGVLFVLWRGRWLMLGCVAAALVFGLIYLSRATPIYSSSSTLYIQQSIPNILSDVLMANTDSAGYLAAQCEVIHSSAILSRALDMPWVGDARCLQGVADRLAFLKASISATPSKQGQMVAVSMESTRPEDAAMIVNGVVEAYIGYQNEQHKSTAVEVLKILQNELHTREAEVHSIQKQIVDFKKANPLVTIETDKGKLHGGRLGALSEALTQAQMRTLDLTVAMQEARAVKDDPMQLKRVIDRIDGLSATADSESLAAAGLAADYERAKERYNWELAALGPNHPEASIMRQQLEVLRAEMVDDEQAAAKRFLKILSSELDAATQREAAIRQALDVEMKGAIDMNVKETQYDELVQQLDNTQRAMDMIDGRIKTVNVTEDVGHLTASVLEPAKPEYAPIRPRPFHVMGMALVSGLMLGLGGALLRERLPQRLHSPEDISHFLDLRVLGAIPHINGKSPATFVQRGREMYLQPHSNVAEAYRSVRTVIAYNLVSQGAKTVVITSPVDGDGKTTLTSNLAISMAQTGRRVLLIDADCRGPMQHKIFSISDKRGLSTVLKGEATFAEVVQKTMVANLDVLSCGEVPTHPAELLDTRTFLDLLKEVSANYDHVLIDSPPVVPIADARILAASCDATILILRAAKSTKGVADHALDILASVGASVVGVVVNDIAANRAARYYQYAYYRSRGDEGNGHGHGFSDHLIDSRVASANVVDAAPLE